jgi:hypothetical protein
MEAVKVKGFARDITGDIIDVGIERDRLGE